jgi:hypothetical protein
MPLSLRHPPGAMNPERPSRDRRIRWLIGAALVAAALVVGAVIVSGSNSTVKTPRLLGLFQPAAQAKAEQAGLHPVFSFEPSDQPRGMVLDQRPHPGRKVPDGITILVTLSSGPPATPSEPVPSPGDGGKGHGNGHGHHDHNNGGGGD